MKLSSILDSSLILFDLSGDDRASIYQRMLSEAVHKKSLDIDVEKFSSDMIAREDAIMIPYEKGVALPHLRSSELEDLYVIIGMLNKPVKLKDIDKEPVRIVIMSLISEKTSDVYLKALSAFSKYLIKPESADKFIACENARELLELLDRDNVTLKKNITAEDVMDSNFPYLLQGASVSEALDLFFKHSKVQLPVLDANKKLIGVLDAAVIIRKSMPKHYMMLDNVKFLSGFELFEKILNQEENVIIDEFLREPSSKISPDTPLIQLTLTLAKEEAKNMFVVDETGRFIGTVTLNEIIQNVLRA